MSGPYQVRKQTAPAQLADLLNALKGEVFASLNCVKVGKIDKFDQVRKCADIQLLFKKVTPAKDKEMESYPLLINCPVFTLQGHQTYFQLPITKGDTALVFFSDRNLDIWWRTGQESAPADHRCHHLTDAIALVGVNSLINQMPPYTADTTLTLTQGTNFICNNAQNVIYNGGNGQDFLINNFQRFIVRPATGAYVMGSFPLCLLQDIQNLIQEFNTHTHMVTQTGVPSLTPMTPASPAIGTKKLFGA
jgi:hypothetical protein